MRLTFGTAQFLAGVGVAIAVTLAPAAAADTIGSATSTHDDTLHQICTLGTPSRRLNPRRLQRQQHRHPRRGRHRRVR